MPPKKFEKPVTFSGWVEDIFNLPKEVTNQTFGVIKTKHQEYLVWVAKARASDADYAEADLIRAFTEGAEALSDLQGINTTIKVNELYAKPIDTIKALGQSTIKQLTDMDDLAGYRRADAIARLTKGQVTDGRGNVPNSRYVDAGRSINNPQNLILKGLTTSRIIPLNPDALIETTPSGKLRSRMQLVKDVTGGKDPAGVGDWEDRKVVEDGIGRDRQHKPYLQLSGAFSQMAMGLESYGSRLSPKITINTQYGRALAQEVGIDLEQVLNGSRGGLKASYDLKIKDPASGRLKSLKDKRLANSGYVTIGSFHRTLAEDAGGDIRKLLSDDNLIAKALAIGPAEYATMDGEVKQFFKNFLENEEIQIRSSYLNPRGELGQAIQAKWKAAGLVPSLEGEIYSGAGAAYIKNDLQHLSNAKSTKQYLLGDASQKQIKAEALKSLKNKYGHDVKLLAEKTGEFYERLEALNEATVSANTLFASATVKDALKAVKDGDFIKAAIVNTRLLGMIPFSNKKMRSPIEWAEILLPDSAQDIVNKGIGNFTKPKIDELKKLISSTTDPVAQQRYLNQIKNLEGLDKWINPITVAKKVSDTAQTAIGIKVKGDKLNPIQNWVNERTGLFNSTVFMEWKQRDPTSMKNAQRYTMTRVNSKDAQGLYGKFGVFSVFEDIEAANLFAHPSLSTLPYIHDIQTMFTDLSNIDAFYAELGRVQSHLKAGTPIPADLLDFYNNVVVPMNFHEALEGAGEFVIDKVMDGYNQYKLSGEVLLNKISDGTKMGVGKLHPADRAQFLKTFKGSGRASQLNDLYIGWLTKYNRYANFFNDYIQKNIIFGDVLTGIPVIGKLFAPIQGIIGNMGFAEEATIAATVRQWKWVQRIVGTGEKASTLGGSISARSSGPLLVKSATLRNLTSKLTGRFAGTALKGLGFAFKGLTAALSGGVAFIISTAGTMAFSASLKLIRGDVKGAKNAIKDEFKGLVKVVKIVVGYPLMGFCGCVIFPIVAIAFAVIAIMVPGSMAPYEEVGEAVNVGSALSQSDLLKVDKSAALSGDKTQINYTVVITNIHTPTEPDDTGEVTIQQISDVSNMILGCDEPNGGTSHRYGDAGFIGTYDSGYNFNQYIGRVLATGESLTITYTLANITDKDATYNNNITVQEAREKIAGKYAIANSTTNIGNGGCNTCPSGWPVTGAVTITNRPGESFTHRGIWKHSIDLSLVEGTEIYATHSGTVETANTGDFGYGTHIYLKSPMGFTSIYGHLSGFAVENGATVQAGDLIGYSGDTGNSTGPHLHYEFRIGGTCQGQPLKMKPPFTPYYVPYDPSY